jgi:hypothetical protein
VADSDHSIVDSFLYIHNICPKFGPGSVNLSFNIKMKKILSKIWKIWKKFGLVTGNFVSAIFLTVFYFTFFAIIAIPYRILVRRPKSNASSFVIKKSTPTFLEDYKYE